MTTRQSFIMHYSLFIFVLLLVGCEGCGGLKNANSPPQEKIVPKNIQETEQNTATQTDKEEVQTTIPKIKLKRNVFEKEISFSIDPSHIGGETWKTVWQEAVPDEDFERYNRIVQLSPTVLLYRRFPKEVAKDFYYVDQAEKIEFLDATFKTIKTVDIWNNRPYQDIKSAKITYHHFNSEGMQVIPYDKQEKKIKPTEYSLFTDVRSEGNHVIINYELRSLETTKSFGIEETSSKIIGVKHTLHIYDLIGNLKYVLKDIPSVDGAVVSNNGEYLMFTFGGTALATANNPFGTMEREGWALMRLRDQKVVYQEYTDDGKLAIQGGGATLDQGFLSVSYSTPNDKDGVYDYFVFFDEETNLIYKKLWTHEEWAKLSMEWKNTEHKDWKYYISKFNFQQIQITNQ